MAKSKPLIFQMKALRPRKERKGLVHFTEVIHDLAETIDVETIDVETSAWELSRLIPVPQSSQVEKWWTGMS